jgi:circadian clock protein KaiC
MGASRRSTVTVLTGSAGVSKTSLGIQFVKAAAAQGKRSVLYTFEVHGQHTDPTPNRWYTRSK